MTTPDVASLGLAIDSSQAEKGALTLDKLSASARKFEDQATKMAIGTTTAFKNVGGGVDAAARKLEDNAAKMSGAFSKVGKDAALGAVAVGSAADKMAGKVEDSAVATTGALKRLERRAGAGVLDERRTIGPNVEQIAEGVYRVHPLPAADDPTAITVARISQVRAELSAGSAAFDALTAAAARAGSAAAAVGAGYAAAGHDVLATTATFDAAAVQVSRQASAEAAAIEDVTRGMERQRMAAERLAGAAAPAGGAAPASVAEDAVTQIVGARVATGDPLEKSTKGVNDNAKAVGLAKHEWINFGRQLQDVGTMAAMGMSPMSIVTSQGAQIFDIFASASGGAKAALADVGSTALRVATHPLTGLVAVIGTAGVAVMRFRDQQAELERALNGVGRAAGASAGQLSAIADATARSGAMSRGQAVSGAAQIAQAGIGVENIPTLLGDAPRFSHAFGLDLADAYAEIVKIVGDQGLGAFERRFGPVSLATKETVTALEQMGRFSEAAAMKTRLFDEEVRKAKDSTGLLARGWEAVISLPGKALDGLGAGLDALLPKFRTVELPREAQAALPAPGAGSLSDYERRIGLSPEITQAQRERDRLDLNRRSELAGPLIDQLSPDDVQRRTMERQLAVLKPLTETADGLAALGERAGAAKEVVARLTTALANFQTPAERMRQDNELAVRSIGAYSFEQRTSIAAEQARVTTLRQTHDETLAAIAAEGARNVALAESARRLDDMAREAQDRAQLRRLSPLQASLAEVDIRYGRLHEQSAPQDAGRIGALQQQERLSVLAQSATQTMDQLRPDLAQPRQLEDARTAIKAMLSDRDGLAALGDRADEARQAFDKLGTALDLLRSPLERVTEANALALRSAEAETAGQRAQIAAEQAFRAEMETSKDRLAAVTAAEGARNVVLLESARAMREQAKQTERRAELAGLGPYERAVREAQLTLQDDLKRANRAPGAGADLGIYDRSVVVPFDRAGTAATRLADAMTGAADRIETASGKGAPSAATGSANVVPLFARSGSGGDFYSAIMRAEGTTRLGDPYNTSLGYRPSPRPLVDMTMRESLAWGEEIARQEMIRTKLPRDEVSSAKGAFQIVNSTQRDAMRALGLGDGDLFNAANQNRMADWIFRTQGIGAWEGFKRPGAVLPAANDNRVTDSQTALVEQPQKIDEASEAYRKYNATLRAINIEQVDNWLRDENRSLDDQRRSIDLASGAWGSNASALAAAEEKQRLLAEAQRLTIPITDVLTKRIETLSKKAADNARVMEEQRRLAADLDIARSGVSGSLSGALKAAANGEDIGQALGQSLTGTRDRVFDAVVNRFTENLLGPQGSADAGAIGKLFGIGGKQSTAQMDVQAAVVNVNGGVHGAPGAPGAGGGLLGSLVSGLGSLFSGGASAAGPALSNEAMVSTGFYADGGLVGTSSRVEMLPASAFIGAPHFADGGHVGIPAVLHAGEIVLNAAQQRNVAEGLRAPASPPQTPPSYAERGGTMVAPAPKTEVHLHGAPAGTEVQESRRPDGGININVLLRAVDRHVSKGISEGRYDKPLVSSFPGMRRGTRPF